MSRRAEEIVRLLDKPDEDARFGGVDWVDLYRQKINLIHLKEMPGLSIRQQRRIEGLLNFLDYLTDGAQDTGFLSTRDDDVPESPDPVRLNTIVEVSTYNGDHPDCGKPGGPEEVGAPYVPVAVRELAGINLALGTRTIPDYDNGLQDDVIHKPAVLVERQHDKWMIQVSSEMAGDPEVHVYVTDAGDVVAVPGCRPPSRNLIYQEETPK